MFSQLATANRCLKMAKSIQQLGYSQNKITLIAETPVLIKKIEHNKQRDKIANNKILIKYRNDFD